LKSLCYFKTSLSTLQQVSCGLMNNNTHTCCTLKRIRYRYNVHIIYNLSKPYLIRSNTRKNTKGKFYRSHSTEVHYYNINIPFSLRTLDIIHDDRIKTCFTNNNIVINASITKIWYVFTLIILLLSNVDLEMNKIKYICTFI